MDRPNWESSLRAVALAVLVASAIALSYMVSEVTATNLLLLALVSSAFILYTSSIWGGFSMKWKSIALLACLAFPAYFVVQLLLWERKYYMGYMGLVEETKYVHQVAIFARKPILVTQKRMLQAFMGKRLIGEGEVYAIRVFRDVVHLTISHEFGYLYFRFSRSEWDKCCQFLVRGSWVGAEGTVQRIVEDRIHFADSKLVSVLANEKQGEGVQR